MKGQIIQQHNAITEARYDMSSAEKNVFYLLLAQLKERGFNEKAYRISVRELANIQGHDIDHIQFKNTSKKLLDQVLSVPLQDGNFIEVSLVSSSEYVRGSGAIELELSEEIRRFLFELKKNFTQFSLQIGLELKSKYAKRIYEMLCQYKDTGIWTISIETLKQRLCLTTKPGKDKYPKYGLFRSKVLDVAKKELQEKSDIYFTYEAKKTGKKYTHLIFKIRKREAPIEIQQAPVQKTSNNAADTLLPFKKLVEKYNLSPWQAERVIKNVPISEIHKTTYDIQIDLLNNKVRNVGGYTAKVFDQKYNLGLFKKG